VESEDRRHRVGQGVGCEWYCCPAHEKTPEYSAHGQRQPFNRQAKTRVKGACHTQTGTLFVKHKSEPTTHKGGGLRHTTALVSGSSQNSTEVDETMKESRIKSAGHRERGGSQKKFEGNSGNGKGESQKPRLHGRNGKRGPGKLKRATKRINLSWGHASPELRGGGRLRSSEVLKDPPQSKDGEVPRTMGDARSQSRWSRRGERYGVIRGPG